MALSGLEILNGPSKFDVMMSLFSGRGRERQYVTFELSDNGKTTALTLMKHKFMLQVCITALTQTVGDGDGWRFEAYITLSRDNFHAPKGARNVKGSYSTTTRTGLLEYTD